jgi:hypothetical protein
MAGQRAGWEMYDGRRSPFIGLECYLRGKEAEFESRVLSSAEVLADQRNGNITRVRHQKSSHFKPCLFSSCFYGVENLYHYYFSSIC